MYQYWCDIMILSGPDYDTFTALNIMSPWGKLSLLFHYIENVEAWGVLEDAQAVGAIL
jgi:hypothetical protein